MKQHQLIIKRSISKARDTEGYNVITLWHGSNRYKACGGGYDMLGTVFGSWLQVNYMDMLKTLTPYDRETQETDNYGLHKSRDGSLYLDGACGLECMIRIAKKIGLQVQQIHNRKGCYTIAFVVTQDT